MHRGALTAELGLFGAMHGKEPKTTIAESGRSPRPGDLVGRRFGPPAPNRLWAADLSYMSYLCRCRWLKTSRAGLMVGMRRCSGYGVEIE
jgi:hypothetical protein